MNQADHRDFVLVMDRMAGIFRATMTPDTIELYWRVLAPFPLDRIEKACFEIVNERTEPFMPVPAEIKEVCARLAPIQQQIEAPQERELTPEEKEQYRMSCAFMVYCIKRGHAPGGALRTVQDWCRERDEFIKDVESGKIVLSRRVGNPNKDKRVGSLIIKVLEDNLKGALKTL